MFIIENKIDKRLLINSSMPNSHEKENFTEILTISKWLPRHQFLIHVIFLIQRTTQKAITEDFSI